MPLVSVLKFTHSKPLRGFELFGPATSGIAVGSIKTIRATSVVTDVRRGLLQ